MSKQDKNEAFTNNEKDTQPNPRVVDALGATGTKTAKEGQASVERKDAGFFSKFDEDVKKSLAFAGSFARIGMMSRDGRRDISLCSDTVDDEHVLMGLVGVSDSDNLATKYLESRGVSLSEVVDKIVDSHGGVHYSEDEPDATSAMPTMSPEAKKIYELALRESIQETSAKDGDLNGSMIHPEHMLAAIFRSGEESGASRILHDLLEEQGIERAPLTGSVLPFKTSGPLLDLRAFVAEKQVIENSSSEK